MYIPPPYTIGLPDHFTDWRPHQMQAISAAINCERRVHAMVAATGSGKSVSYLTVGLYLGLRTCILTATKALQDQLLRDYGDIAVLVKGKNAYPCKMLGGQYTCDHGLCNWDMQCVYKARGCAYFDALRKARSANIVITNYHFWLANNKLDKTSAQDKIGKFDLLVCDEAHQAPAIVADQFTVEFNKRRKADNQLLGSYPWDGQRVDVIRWLHRAQDVAEATAKSCERHAKDGGAGYASADTARWRDAALRTGEAARLLESDNADILIIEEAKAGKVRVAPVWPYAMGGKLLFADIGRILMTSATVRAKTLGLLGLKKDDYQIREYPHTFPVENRRLVWLPTVRMNKDTTSDGLRAWQNRIDQILETRLDRKGIIHSVSYQRQRDILQNSQYKDHLMGHHCDTLAKFVDKFRNNKTPRCIVSPSLTTGYDFPYDLCRFQIITKIPFPDTRDRLTAARCKQDNELGPYQAATDLVQSVGRGCRCFDTETELLTESGWKRYSEVLVGDVCFGVDPTVWEKETKQSIKGCLPLKGNVVKSVFVGVEKERMTQIKGQNVDVCVTPDHTMIIQRRKCTTHKCTCTKPYGRGRYTTKHLHTHKSGGFTKVVAQDLPVRFKLPMAGRIGYRKSCLLGGKGLKDSLDWFRLMGIIISDGYLSKNRAAVCIYQSKPDTVRWIDTLIQNLGLKHRRIVEKTKGTSMSVRDGKEYVRNHNKVTWVFSGHEASAVRDIFKHGRRRRKSKVKAYRLKTHKGTHGCATVYGWFNTEKTIPEWVIKRASVSQMRALIEGLMRGDGSIKKDDYSGCYYTSVREIADRFQAVAALCGYRTVIHKRRSQYEVSLNGIGTADCYKEMVTTSKQKHIPWCVNTELGTVVIRRKGKVFICGNSASDWCENFIIDDGISWFIKRYKHFMPQWFVESGAFKTMPRDTVPDGGKL